MMKIALCIFCVTIALTPFYTSANDELNKAPTAVTASEQLTLVNINIADEKTLSSLKGIGEKKAQAIIQYREMNGDFTSIDDLLKIDGIGKKVLAENKAILKI